jgi:periplasmic divalent cation tolerance protein
MTILHLEGAAFSLLDARESMARRKAPEFVEVLVTAGSPAEARRLARALVERRLAACVNLHPIRSVYRWKGKVEEAREVALAVKTTRARFPALRAAVRELHSYEVPCILALPVAEGHAPYLRWVRESTAAPPSRGSRERRKR